MAFDPDKFLAESSFDVDSFLEEDKAPAPEREEMGAIEAGISGLGEGSSFGYGDELAGAVGAAIDRPVTYLMDKYAGVPEDMAGVPEDSNFVDRYKGHRDSARSYQKQAQEDQPGAFMGGQLAGGLASGIALGGVGPQSLVGKAALEGGAYGLGTSEADLTEGEYGQAALDTAIGAGTGALLGKGLQKGGQALKKTAPYLKGKGEKLTTWLRTKADDFAQDAAEDILEMTPGARKKIERLGVTLGKGETDSVAGQLPKFMKEKGFGFTGTVKKFKKTIQEVKDTSGKQIDDITTTFEERIQGLDEELTKLSTQYGPSDAMTRRNSRALGVVRKNFRDKAKYSYDDLADTLEEEVLAPILNEPGFSPQANKLSKYIDEIRAKGAREGDQLSMKELNHFRKKTDSLIKDFSKSPEKMTEYEKALRFVRKDISDHVKDNLLPAFDELQASLHTYSNPTANKLLDFIETNKLYKSAEELYQANKDYSMSATIMDEIDNAIARKDARRIVSLTDFITGAALTTVSPGLGAGALALKKGAELARPRAQLYAPEIVESGIGKIKPIAQKLMKGIESITEEGVGRAATPLIQQVAGTKYAQLFGEDTHKNAVTHRTLMNQDPEYKKMYMEKEEE